MARLNFNDGSYEPNYRASPYIPYSPLLRLYEYDDYIYHYNDYTFSRFSMNGDLDNDWPPNGYTLYGSLAGIKYLPVIDRFFLAGFFFSDKDEFENSKEKGLSCLWFDLDGNRDTTFSAPIFHFSPGIQDSSQHFSHIGKWKYSDNSNYAYVVTSAQYANGRYSNNIFRIFPDGHVDNSFQFVEGGQLESINGILQTFEQNDGKVIVTGSFYIRDAEKEIFTTMIRLNLDGSFDPTFNYKNNTLPEDFAENFDPERDKELYFQNEVKYVTYWKDDLYIVSGSFIIIRGSIGGK